MSLEDNFQDKAWTGSKAPSTWWFIALVFLLIVNVLVWLYWFDESLWASLFSILTVAILASNRSFRQFHRLIYLMVIPGLLALTLVTHGFYWLIITPGYSGPFGGIVRWLAGDPLIRFFASFLLGLLAGILAPLAILEIYVLINQDVIYSFTELDVKSTRSILKSLFLNVNRPYILVKDGKEERIRPAGLNLLGGPGTVVILPGNAVVFEKGGKLDRVELNGIHKTKKFERIHKIIRLTSRSNISGAPPPNIENKDLLTAGESKPVPSPKRNVRNLQTKDRICIDLDLLIFFQIKQKPRAEQDSILLEFSGQRVQDLEDPYPVDKQDVLKAATRFNDWEKAVVAITEDTLRKVVGQHNLDELFEITTGDNSDPKFGEKFVRKLKSG